MAAWDGDVIGSGSLRVEQDDGIYVIKNGSDFRGLSEMGLVLEATVRRKIIKEITGRCLHLIVGFPLYFERETIGYNARFQVL